MAKTLLVNSGTPVDTVASSTEYYAYGVAGNTKSSTEANRQVKISTNGTLSKLCVVISANTTTASSTVRTRRNGPSIGLSISINSGSTGTFEDTTNIDNITSGDLLCYQVVTGAGGVLTIAAISTVFTPSDSRAFSTMVSVFPTPSFTAASTTVHQSLSGDGTVSTSTSEPNFQVEARVASVLKNLSVRISANSRTTTTTFRTRKNATNGNMVVNIGSGVTGLVEDLTNTDSVAVNDRINTLFTTGTGTQSISIEYIKVDHEIAGHDGLLVSADGGAGISQAAITTNFVSVGGSLKVSTTESTKRLKVREAFTISNMGVNVTANSSNFTTTFRLRKNGADGNQVISVTAGTTGFLEDTTNSDVLVANDEINFSVVTGVGINNITYRSISAVTTLIILQNLTRTTADSFTITHSDIPRIRLLIQTLSESLSLTHLTDRTRFLLQLMSDNLTITDELIAKYRLLLQFASDSFSFSGVNITTLKSLFREFEVELFMLSFSESMSRIKTVLKSINNLSDLTFIETSIFIFRELFQTMNDSFGISELIQRLRHFIQFVNSDNLGILSFSEASNKIRYLIQFVTHTLPQFDNIHNRLRGKVRRITDLPVLSFSDTRSFISSRLRGFENRLTLNLNFSKSTTRVRTVFETLGLLSGDSMKRIKTKLKTVLHDPLTVFSIDQLNRYRMKWMKITGAESHNLTLTHSSFTGFYNRIRYFTNNLHLTEEIPRYKTKLKSLLQSQTTISLSHSFIALGLSYLTKTIQHELTIELNNISRLRTKVTRVIHGAETTLSLSSIVTRIRPIVIKFIEHNPQELILSNSTASRLRLFIMRNTPVQNLSLSSTVLKTTRGAIKTIRLKIKRFKVYRRL